MWSLQSYCLRFPAAHDALLIRQRDVSKYSQILAILKWVNTECSEYLHLVCSRGVVVECGGGWANVFGSLDLYLLVRSLVRSRSIHPSDEFRSFINIMHGIRWRRDAAGVLMEFSLTPPSAPPFWIMSLRRCKFYTLAQKKNYIFLCIK